jgi:radical SAM protein with 4Fe4S-binding SPASM domain
MRIFDELNIETQSTCNRTCPTCLRQSYPDVTALAGRFVVRQMPDALVYSLLDQAAAMGFRGRICMQHFNEPLQDARIADFGRYAKGLNVFDGGVFLNTNGDYLTAEWAARLDGAYDWLNVALYGGNKAKRAAQYTDWFTATRLTFTAGEHIITHFSPGANLAELLALANGQPCEREAQMRCIIGYDGKMMLCCDDIAAEYDLGNAHDTPLDELWFGERHAAVLKTLSKPGGRLAYAYCRTCPRVNTPYWSQEVA